MRSVGYWLQISLVPVDLSVDLHYRTRARSTNCCMLNWFEAQVANQPKKVLHIPSLSYRVSLPSKFAVKTFFVWLSEYTGFPNTRFYDVFGYERAVGVVDKKIENFDSNSRALIDWSFLFCQHPSFSLNFRKVHNIVNYMVLISKYKFMSTPQEPILLPQVFSTNQIDAPTWTLKPYYKRYLRDFPNTNIYVA